MLNSLSFASFILSTKQTAGSHRKWCPMSLLSRALDRLGKVIAQRRSHQDDFDWGTYPSQYALQLSEIQRVHTVKLSPSDYFFSNGKLTLQRDILPLHPNHRLLYETILQLQAKSIMEVGCGGGDHLYNLMILSPQIQLHGCDLSTEMLALARQRSPDLRADMQLLDITLPNHTLLPLVDLCFTQAVIMHIKGADRHLVALANLFRIATRQVVLMENWSQHDFLGDIQMLRGKGKISWHDLFFYYKASPELNRPHLMVVSAHPLDYPSLTDYRILLNPLLAE
jgi:SAM-dependent methyltransferase